MRPVWFVEAGVHAAVAEPPLAEVRRQGMNPEVVTFGSLLRATSLMAGGWPLANGDCVRGYGTGREEPLLLAG